MDRCNERRQIRQEVKSLIGKGQPKQQILEDLSHRYKDKIAIVKLLETTPSIASKKKYCWYNGGLFILLLTILTLDAVSLLKFFSPAWFGEVQPVAADIRWIVGIFACAGVLIDAALIAGTWFYRIAAYRWIAARGVVLLLQLAVVHLYHGHAADVPIFVSLGLMGISFLLGMFMGVKLCPPRVPKIVDVEIDHHEKIQKTVYVFAD